MKAYCEQHCEQFDVVRILYLVRGLLYTKSLTGNNDDGRLIILITHRVKREEGRNNYSHSSCFRQRNSCSSPRHSRPRIKFHKLRGKISVVLSGSPLSDKLTDSCKTALAFPKGIHEVFKMEFTSKCCCLNADCFGCFPQRAPF